VLSIVPDASGRWTAAEIGNRASLGYGTYRWVVNSDLRRLDAHDVLGMFTYGGGGPSNNEIDFEPSHWGNLAWPDGSATVWQDARAERRTTRSFRYRGGPPYAHEFTWQKGRIDYRVSNGDGAVLLQWSVTKAVPRPSSEVPRVNYWRYEGAPPTAPRSMRLASFDWRPLVRMPVRPARVTVTPRRQATIHATAATTTPLRLKLQRSRRGRLVTVGTLNRVVRAGTGRVRLSCYVGGRHLPRGRYTVSAATAGVTLAPKRLRLTVAAGAAAGRPR
jgi:hypothetical protein